MSHEAGDRAVATRGMKIPTRSMELMLIGWQDHHNTGFKVTFEVPPEDEDYFRNATSKKGKMAGQRYAVVLVELGPDELPVPGSADKKKQLTPEEAKAQTSLDIPTKKEHITETVEKAVAKDAVEEGATEYAAKFPAGLCGLAVRWCDDAHFQGWLLANFKDKFVGEGEDGAKQALCAVCEIKSRKELDTDAKAGARFRAAIMEPYKEQREADKVDDDAPF